MRKNIHKLIGGITFIILFSPCNTSCVNNQRASPGLASEKPLKVYILAGQSNMMGSAHQSTFPAIGDDPKTAHLLNDILDQEGNPVVSEKAWVSYLFDRNQRDTVIHGKVKVGYGFEEGRIGPEYAFGLYMDKALEEPILIIKTAWGGKSLAVDYRPPSSGPYEPSSKEKERNDIPDLEEVGHYYRKMISFVRETLKDAESIGKIVPNYNPKQGYELSGFVWFQGWNDMCNRHHIEQYTENMIHFISDVRKEFEKPDLPFIVGILGVYGTDPDSRKFDKGLPVSDFRRAQFAAVELYDEKVEKPYRGNVKGVDSGPYYELELSDIYWKQRLNNEWKNRVSQGKMTLEEAQKERSRYGFKEDGLTAQEQKIWDRCASNAEYHYLGSGKTFIRFGKALAEAMLEMEGDSENVIYVAENGKDSNPGTFEHPLASLNHAINIVQKSKLDKARDISKVIIREGVYYLPETIQLDKNDSGTEDQTLVFTAHEDEKVTISGAMKLDCNWEVFKNGIYKCHVPEIEGKEIDQLFVNGKRQIRARYPNGNSLYPDLSAFIYPLKADDWPHKRIFYDPDGFTSNKWKNPESAILNIFPHNHWGNLQIKVKDINYEDNYFDIEHRKPQINETFFKLLKRPGTLLSERSNYFIDNVFEELDAEEEWYFDEKESFLYYKPIMNTSLEDAIVEVPVLEKLVNIKGTSDEPVEYIEFHNIRFTGTLSTYMADYEYPSLGDWGIVRSGAVFIEGASHCSVKNCFFDAVGGNAVFINNYAESIEVSGNVISECGESAVCLVGKSHLNFEDSYKCEFCGADHPWSWDNPSLEIPSNCLIDNNLIHDIGVFGKQVAGVFLSIAKSNTISHNHIYKTPRAAICMNDGWHGGHNIEFNDIHNTVRETGDHGPINSWGRETFWCREQSHGKGVSHEAGDVLKDAYLTTHIRNNRFRDNSGWGIDLDDGSSNYKVYNNLCIGVSVKLREGDYRIVENNIFYKGANPPSIHRGYENNQDIFRRNIVVVDTLRYNPTEDYNFVSHEVKEKVFHFIGVPEKSKFVFVLDSNCYSSSSGNFQARINVPAGHPVLSSKYMDLEEWQSYGLDKNSILADPLFTDPENGDFSLGNNSPAFKIGFKEFALDSFGLTHQFANIYWQ